MKKFDVIKRYIEETDPYGEYTDEDLTGLTHGYDDELRENAMAVVEDGAGSEKEVALELLEVLR